MPQAPRHKRKTKHFLNLEPLEGRALLSTIAEPLPKPSNPPVRVRSLADEGTFRVAKRMSNRTYSRNGSKLDVYAPAGATPPEGGWPAIVAMPGGGWKWASKDEYGAGIAGMAKYGYVIVAIEYAFSNDRPSWPANINDVRAAIRWVRSNAAKLNVNPDRIATMGESAGGHLAALAAVLPDGPVKTEGANTARSRPVPGEISSRVQAAVVFYGPTDLPLEWQQQPEVRPYLARFLGGTLAKREGRYVAASPISHVSSDDPPVYLVQGTRDHVVDSTQATNFADALQKVGVNAKVQLLEGAPHGIRFRIKSDNMRKLIRFLKENL